MQHRFYLAPLRGVTDSIFRTIYENHFGKFDYLLTPFITSVKGREVKPTHIRDISGIENDRQRVIPQILGNDPQTMAVLAEAFFNLGYKVVNLNLGCPHPQVYRKGRGSGLLPYPDTIASILEYLLAHSSPVLSVKLRLGLDDPNDIMNILPVLNRYPLSEIIIHPRTGVQGYTGHVDLDTFEEAMQKCRSPVVYNGDITSLETFVTLQKRFPTLSQWMIGRGVIQKPWLLALLRFGIEQRPIPEILQNYHEDLFAAYAEKLCGPSHLLGKMKEFWYYFSRMFPDSIRVFRIISRCTTIGGYRKHVSEIMSTVSAYNKSPPV